MPSRSIGSAWFFLSFCATSFVFSGCGPLEPGVARTPTYHEDVAPIIAEHCGGCHRPGGIGIFSLLDYESAKRNADAIRISTAKRTMPPFGLDNSGACNTYREARWLSDEQIELLGAWARAGAPEGDPEAAPPPAPGRLPALERVDATIDMKVAYEPDPRRFDDYRCFVVDPGFSEERFVIGFDVHPGVEKMVHHLTLFALDTDEEEAQAEALDAADPGVGYACPDDLMVDGARWIVGVGPESGALVFPEGTGLRMHAGRKAILQMHYNQENGLAPDRTKIDVMLADAVVREASVVRVADLDLYLPPKQPRATATGEMRAPADAVWWGLWPHMHKLGVAMRIEAEHDGEERCLARVDDWNFHWQGFAHYTKPIALHEGDSIRITCTYDTRSRDGVTMWGQGTNDEMCIAFFYMTGD